MVRIQCCMLSPDNVPSVHLVHGVLPLALRCCETLLLLPFAMYPGLLATTYLGMDFRDHLHANPAGGITTPAGHHGMKAYIRISQMQTDHSPNKNPQVAIRPIMAKCRKPHVSSGACVTPLVWCLSDGVMSQPACCTSDLTGATLQRDARLFFGYFLHPHVQSHGQQNCAYATCIVTAH